MKLSNDTRDVLKNYATINANLLVKTGNKISTMSQMKNIVSIAELPDNFEQEFAIYDLTEFLSAMSLFNDPELEFNENNVRMCEGHQSLKYFYSDPSVVTTPSSDITMPKTEVNFSLDSSDLSKVQRAASVIGSPDLVLEKNGVGSYLTVKDKKNDTANNYSLDVDVEGQGDYDFYFKVENLKLMPLTYDVNVSSKNISHFKSQTSNAVEYWIALEPESSYSE